jgi:hypothetical protein
MRRPPPQILIISYAFVTLWGLVPLLVHVDQFTGKLVGISDEDIIGLLREGVQNECACMGAMFPRKLKPWERKRGSL